LQSCSTSHFQLRELTYHRVTKGFGGTSWMPRGPHPATSPPHMGVTTKQWPSAHCVLLNLRTWAPRSTMMAPVWPYCVQTRAICDSQVCTNTDRSKHIN
jgi:hypothetical protein